MMLNQATLSYGLLLLYLCLSPSAFLSRAHDGGLGTCWFTRKNEYLTHSYGGSQVYLVVVG